METEACLMKQDQRCYQSFVLQFSQVSKTLWEVHELVVLRV